MLNFQKLWSEMKGFTKPAILGLAAYILPLSVLANPVLENVSKGQVSVEQSTNNTTVNQTSSKALINWQSFKIGASQTTHFQQPAGGVALNRVNRLHGPPQINGRLTATGQVMFVSPAGFSFVNGTFVNVAAIINAAPNLSLSDQDFLNYYYQLANSFVLHNAIFTHGQKIAADNGLLALIGGAVGSDGMIEANIEYSGMFTITFAANELVSFAVDRQFYRNVGKVFISAKSASGILDRVINTDGIASIKSVYSKAGSIVLSGDPGGEKTEFNTIFFPLLQSFNEKNIDRPAVRHAVLFITTAMLKPQYEIEPVKSDAPILTENTENSASKLILTAKGGDVILQSVPAVMHESFFAARGAQPVVAAIKTNRQYDNINAIAEYAGFTNTTPDNSTHTFTTAARTLAENVTAEGANVTFAVANVPHDPSYVNINGTSSFAKETDELGSVQVAVNDVNPVELNVSEVEHDPSYVNVNGTSSFTKETSELGSVQVAMNDVNPVELTVSEVEHDPSYVNVNGTSSFTEETHTLGHSSVATQPIPEHELMLAFATVTTDNPPPTAKPVTTTAVATYTLPGNLLASVNAMYDIKVPAMTSNKTVISLEDGNITTAENVDNNQAEEIAASGNIVISDVIEDSPPPATLAENDIKPVDVPPAPSLTFAAYTYQTPDKDTEDSTIQTPFYVSSGTTNHEVTTY